MSIRAAAFLFLAVLLTAGAGPVLAAGPAADTQCAAVCQIRPASEDHATVAADSLFDEVCPVPAGFARGLVLLDEGYAVADRHEDLIVFFDRQGRRLRTLEYPAYEPAALSWDGRHLVAADRENDRIYFLDPQSGEAVRMIESPLSPVVAVACDEEGRLWIAAGGGEELQLIDPYDGTTLASLKAPAKRLDALAFDPGGYLWAADAGADLIYLVDIRTGYTIFRIASPGPVPAGLWLDGKDLHVADYQTDTVSMTDVYALHAPRPLQCQNGLGEGPRDFCVPLAREAMAEIRRAYRDLGAGQRVELHVHPEGHIVDVPAMRAFLDRYLRP